MMKLPFDPSKPVIGQASVQINKPARQVFEFVGEKFFVNYPKWALEVVEFEPLDGEHVFVGAKAKQIRLDQGQTQASVFEITDFNTTQLVFKGLDEPYRNIYSLENQPSDEQTLLTFCFELLELELFMRPFEKLIRSAIEEGAENTVENIKRLLAEPCVQAH
ncbi:hypothetical protein JCM14076_23830 [Methylosoma difficile]